MGIFTVPIELGEPDGPTEHLEATVDTGATFTMIPAGVLRRLGVEPSDRAPFALADGRRVERDIGVVTVRVDGQRGPTRCIFGADDDDVLLGAVTLEEFLLAVDPVNKTLVRVAGRLASLGA